MLDHKNYVPVLKWRMGEYQALMRLSEAVKDWTTPLLEIPTEGWNFETEAPSKSLDDHLANFGDKLFSKWGGRTCFVDSPYLDGSSCLLTGVHHFEEILNQAHDAGCHVVPVTGLQRHAAYNAAIGAAQAEYGRGVCIRLNSDDFTPALADDIGQLLLLLGVAPANIDLVIDLADGIVSSPIAQAHVWHAMLNQVAYAPWRSLVVAGTAFPANLSAAQFRPHGRTPRHEWLAYQQLMAVLPRTARRPTFGDYATSAPNTSELDPRMLDPNAKIKYTLDNEWIVFVGLQVKRNGRGQYQTMCAHMISHHPSFFMGATYSWGDAYIAGCAAGSETTGGTSTWPSVATNHHVTKVVRDVANFHGASAPA